MITLKEFFDSLAQSELSTLALGNSGQLSIPQKDYVKVVNAVNLGLLEIFKQLNLRERKLTLHQQTGILTYYLREEYAEELANIGGEYYIELPDGEEFPDDIIRPVSAKDSDNKIVYIDDNDHPYDFFTRANDILEIAAPCDEGREAVDVFTITYQAKHPKIYVPENFDPAKVELEISDSVLHPLMLITTNFLLRKPGKLAKGELHPNAGVMAEFHNAMRALKEDGYYVHTTEASETRFQRKGFP